MGGWRINGKVQKMVYLLLYKFYKTGNCHNTVIIQFLCKGARSGYRKNDVYLQNNPGMSRKTKQRIVRYVTLH